MLKRAKSSLILAFELGPCSMIFCEAMKNVRKWSGLKPFGDYLVGLIASNGHRNLSSNVHFIFAFEVRCHKNGLFWANLHGLTLKYNLNDIFDTRQKIIICICKFIISLYIYSWKKHPIWTASDDENVCCFIFKV